MTGFLENLEPKRRLSDAAAVLQPYSRDSTGVVARRRRRWVVIAMVTFCLFYGAAFAFLAPALLLIFVAPPAILGLIVIWTLPETSNVRTEPLEFLFYIFLVASILWPYYLAFKLPGLPWITMGRLIGLPLFVVFLSCIRASAQIRRELGAALAATPTLWKLVAALCFIEFYTIALSPVKGQSIDKFVVAQTNWTVMFFLGCYIFLKPHRVERWAAIIWATIMPVGVIGIWENHLKKVPWVGHIPSFLQIQDPTVILRLTPNFSHGGERFGAAYRAQSTFGGAIQLSEFLAMAMPFIFHFAIQPYRLRVRVAATLTIPFAVYIIYISHSRTGWVGLALSCLLYPAAVLFIAIKRGRANRWAATALAGYPVASVLGMAVVLASGRLRRLLLGGSETTGSNLARVAQWQMGWPKIFKNPIGHGLGSSGDVLGFRSPTGILTVDSYYLTILLELGVIGFLVYFGTFVFGIFTAVRAAARSSELEREVSFLAPAAVSIANFVVIKSIFSQMDNHWMAFTLLGMVAALVARSNSQPSLAVQAGAQLRTTGPGRAGRPYFAPSH